MIKFRVKVSDGLAPLARDSFRVGKSMGTEWNMSDHLGFSALLLLESTDLVKKRKLKVFFIKLWLKLIVLFEIWSQPNVLFYDMSLAAHSFLSVMRTKNSRNLYFCTLQQRETGSSRLCSSTLLRLHSCVTTLFFFLKNKKRPLLLFFKHEKKSVPHTNQVNVFEVFSELALSFKFHWWCFSRFCQQGCFWCEKKRVGYCVITSASSTQENKREQVNNVLDIHVVNVCSCCGEGFCIGINQRTHDCIFRW